MAPHSTSAVTHLLSVTSRVPSPRRQREAQFSGGVRGGGRADYLGFYRLLGLDATGGQGHAHISQVGLPFGRVACILETAACWSRMLQRTKTPRNCVLL